ncbi:MAG TPA: STAS domain-containing protein [Ilumatobacteraceae bacterium]|jgi:anti-sigma B factor antagonist|nr:STAS domain-containing protein [Ilumatobacteraceae bacterium]
MDSNKNFLTMATAPDGALIVAGDIDMAGGPILEQALLERESELLAQGGGDIVVDLTGVDFMDSSGLRSMLATARSAAARQANLELRSVGPQIIRLLEITGTVDQFTIASRRD